MKMVVQRVTQADVTVNGECVGSISRGLLVLVGVEDGDTEETADRLVHKLLGLRIFSDAQGKTNLSLSQVGGELLLVSQFTLCADCRKGFRPSFMNAAAPDEAEQLFLRIVMACRDSVRHLATGQFGADMQVSLVNDGPFTVILDSRDI